jgi:hypothetical protein
MALNSIRFVKSELIIFFSLFLSQLIPEVGAILMVYSYFTTDLGESKNGKDRKRGRYYWLPTS